MTNDPAPEVKLVLSDHAGLGRMTVELEPFFELSFWLAEELQDLIAAHKQYSRPESSRFPHAIRQVQ